MTSHRRFAVARFGATALVLVALIAACGGTAPSPSASAATTNKPTVVVQSPTNGAILPVGGNVAVAGAASDSIGVDHVALFADGVSVATTPSGQPAPLTPFSLTWLATPAGPHVLQVIAYRADGTPSDPAVVNVVVGAGGSIPLASGPSIAPFSAPPSSGGGLVTPKPSKKPKPSKTPSPTKEPRPPTPTPTADSNGYAPDDIDDEPYEIELTPDNADCPAIDTGVPVTASGCIWEQISAPAGDMSDELEFTQDPETSYHFGLTACTDTSGATAWSDSGEDVTGGFGCKQFDDKTSSGGNPGSQPIFVGFGTVATQTYNVYQFTVYQCTFANCASH
jgi:Big-like domain-containing protein